MWSAVNWHSPNIRDVVGTIQGWENHSRGHVGGGGDFITNECKKFSDTNLTDVIRRKFTPKFTLEMIWE